MKISFSQNEHYLSWHLKFLSEIAFDETRKLSWSQGERAC